MNTPYTLKDYRLSGVYLLKVGSLFYVGSTSCFGTRLSQHRCLLRDGKHWNPILQLEFDGCGELSMEIVEVLQRRRHEGMHGFRPRLKTLEQKYLDRMFPDPNCTNLSESTRHNTTLANLLKRRWQNQEYRDAQIERMQSARGPVSEETRKKMAKAKTGKANARSRACTLVFKGEIFRFESASLAAARFGVSQQCMHCWLSGMISWPGITTNLRTKSKKTHLVGLFGGYDEPMRESESTARNLAGALQHLCPDTWPNPWKETISEEDLKWDIHLPVRLRSLERPHPRTPGFPGVP